MGPTLSIYIYIYIYIYIENKGGEGGSRKREESEREKMLFYFYFLRFSLRYTEFKSLEFVGPRTKVPLLDKGYDRSGILVVYDVWL